MAPEASYKMNGQNELKMKGWAAIVFMVSLIGICAELLFTLIVGMKSWSHMAYVVISFALLGYGVGSTLILALEERIRRINRNNLLAMLLILLAFGLFLSSQVLPSVPLELTMITKKQNLPVLVLVCTAVALPFVAVGFTIVYIFQIHVEQAGLLYFWDLLGAGAGAAVFYFLLGFLGPLNTLAAFAGLLVVAAGLLVGFQGRIRKLVGGLLAVVALVFGVFATLPEPEYEVDLAVGWEWIPGHAGKDGYTTLMRQWNPMGRTDLYRITNPEFLNLVIKQNWGTFQLNVSPLPPVCYFVNSFRAGTPVFNLTDEGLSQNSSKVVRFSQPMEFPYLLIKDPRVLVIGTGGGRDIFMAKTHGAVEVIGAEINPSTCAAMSPGGLAYELSGRVYTQPGVTVANVDGRHLVKTQPSDQYDLMILNGVDTFAALSSGAYVFVENYLYTKQAVMDYLRVIKPNGFINFNRWFEERPRETLRLFGMILEALRSSGAREPWNHIVVGCQDSWGMVLAKKTPFTENEIAEVLKYFDGHRVDPVYAGLDFPRQHPNFHPLGVGVQNGRCHGFRGVNAFDAFARTFQEGREKDFMRNYWADVSVPTDDRPFFYKYYRFNLDLAPLLGEHARSAPAFYVQFLIFLIALGFIVVFILIPLYFLKRTHRVPRASEIPLVIYFSCLGLGFIFFEISMMQRLTLLLGNSIYSISVTLAALLVFSAIGSFLAQRFSGSIRNHLKLVAGAALAVGCASAAVVAWAVPVINALVAFPFWGRVLACALALLPLGIPLGMFMPLGLLLVGRQEASLVAWAWGINFGFTVLGSVVSIVIAQFLGFNVVLLLAFGLYVIATAAYWRWRAGSCAREPVAVR